MRWNEERIILANPDILSESHAPPEIHARETQMKKIGLCLRLLKGGGEPMNCWLYGKPGVGKTSTSRCIMRKLDNEASLRGRFEFTKAWRRL